jgi:hypothetical protein
MEFSLCNYTRNPNSDFKIVSSLYFTKDLHCEIINRLLGSNIVLNTENFDTNYTSLIVNGTLTGIYNISSAKIMLIEERKYRLGCSDSSISDASCHNDK